MTIRLTTPKEFQEQIYLFDWRQAVVGQEPRLAALFAIPNGEERPAQWIRSRQTGALRRVSRVGQKLKAMGVTPGIPDVFLAVPRPGEAGLWIELKRSGLTDAQAWNACSVDERQWLRRLETNGYAVQVCSGWVRAAHCLCGYLCRLDLWPAVS